MKNNSIYLKKGLLLFLGGLLSISVSAQKWFFELNPGLKYYSINTFQTKGDVINSTQLQYDFVKNNSSKKFQVEPQLYIDFFRPTQNLKIGLGFSTYNWSSTIFASSTGKTTISGIDQDLLYTERINKSIYLQYSQFIIRTTHSFSISQNMDRYLINSIGFEVGINKPSSFNGQNSKYYYSSYIQTNEGYLNEITYKKTSLFGRFSPFLSLKYEVKFLNKKNKSGFLNFFFSYTQGLVQQYDFSMSSFNSNNSSLRVYSIGRGSGFRFGVSKTLHFKLNKNI